MLFYTRSQRRSYINFSCNCLLKNAIHLTQFEVFDHESVKGKVEIKAKSQADRRGTQNGIKNGVKEPTRRGVSINNDVKEWPCVLCGEPFKNCALREGTLSVV